MSTTQLSQLIFQPQRLHLTLMRALCDHLLLVGASCVAISSGDFSSPLHPPPLSLEKACSLWMHIPYREGNTGISLTTASMILSGLSDNHPKAMISDGNSSMIILRSGPPKQHLHLITVTLSYSYVKRLLTSSKLPLINQ